jgi:hypothetical protein
VFSGEVDSTAAPWNEILFNTPVFLLRTFRDAPSAAPPTLVLPPEGSAVSLAVDAPPIRASRATASG